MPRALFLSGTRYFSRERFRPSLIAAAAVFLAATVFEIAQRRIIGVHDPHAGNTDDYCNSSGGGGGYNDNNNNGNDSNGNDGDDSTSSYRSGPNISDNPDTSNKHCNGGSSSVLKDLQTAFKVPDPAFIVGLACSGNDDDDYNVIWPTAMQSCTR